MARAAGICQYTMQERCGDGRWRAPELAQKAKPQQSDPGPAPGRAPGRALGRDPERSRRLLIEATLDSIAENGISDTTVSRIVDRAGVSRGMIHLHFGGKDRLLEEAAKTFCGAYYAEMERQLAGIPDDPAETIMAIVRADLSEALLNERAVAIWHGFRGVARRSPAIAQYSDTRDARLRRMICDAFHALLDRGRHGGQDGSIADDITLGTLALLEGMWTDFLTHPDTFSREAAVRIVTRFLAAMFPGRFRV